MMLLFHVLFAGGLMVTREEIREDNGKNKQGQIRDGMWRLLIKWESLPVEKRVRHHLIDDILRFQATQGVVLKVPIVDGQCEGVEFYPVESLIEEE